MKNFKENKNKENNSNNVLEMKKIKENKEKNSFKIEIEVEKNSLNNHIVETINNIINKYKRINPDKISYKDKYIIAMFINSLSSKDYKLEHYDNINNNYRNKNRFINFEQPKIDFEKLRQLEIEYLKQSVKDIKPIEMK